MRIAAVALVLSSAASYALPAAAQDFAPRLTGGLVVGGLLSRGLSLDASIFDVGDLGSELAAASPSIVIPPRYGWILDDGRAFWFSAGASSVVALGSHVLVGLPTLFVAGQFATQIATTSPAAMVPFLVGVGGVYMLAQTALSSLAAVLFFNGTSKIYDGNYLAAFAGHIAGSILGVAVSALSFGVGYMLVGGLGLLVEFTGSAGLQAIQVFSLLGALPAVVIGGIALVGVPALVGAWAMAVSATPKAGYVVTPAWQDPAPAPAAALLPKPAVDERTGAVAVPLLTIPLPG